MSFWRLFFSYILPIGLIVGGGLYLYYRRRPAVLAQTERYGVPLLAAGEVLTIVGAFLPWSRNVTLSAPLAGNLSSAGLGGHRLYIFLLALVALVAFAPTPVRRRVGVAAALGAGGIAVYMLLSVVKEGGGGGALAVGTWLTLVGAILLFLGADTRGADDEADLVWPALHPAVAVLLLVVVIGAGLAVLNIGLDIDEQKQFISFAILVVALIFAARPLGVSDAFRRAFEEFRFVGYGLALLAAVAFPFIQGENATWDAVFARAGVFAAAAIGLNVVVGLAGLLDLGYIAFFGVGGYFSALMSNAIFTTVHVHLPFLLVIPLGAMLAGLIGVIVGAPTLRLRGDYLAIVTLGFGEIFRIVAQNWTGLTQGPNGISGIPDLRMPGWLGGFQFGKPHTVFGTLLPYQSNYYFLDILLIVVVMVVFARLNDSRIGRAWVAIREDELAARATGLNTVALKLLAFGIGATLAGGAGTINAHIGGAVEPNAYQFIYSALLLAAVVLGGMGTVSGALLGAMLLYGLPEKLRFLIDYRLLIFGVALVLLMRFRPEGLIVSTRRQREFHDTESGADAMSQSGQVAPV